jgi:hypothetical protein
MPRSLSARPLKPWSGVTFHFSTAQAGISRSIWSTSPLDEVRKQFLRSKDCLTAGGVYLWNDERAARAFMNERVVPMIREKLHVDPTVEFYDSPVIVEN